MITSVRSTTSFATRADHSDPIFKKYPSTETVTTSGGDVVSFPYHGYDADGQLIHGFADIEALRAIMKGSGQEPQEVQGGKGIVTLWLMRYNDTNIGSYDELVVTIATAQPGAKPIENKGAMTAMWPLLSNAPTFAYKLVLNSRLAVDYGRELMGLDKSLGRVLFDRHGDGTRVEVSSTSGARVLLADTSVDSGVLATLVSAAQLIKSVGIVKTLKGLLIKEQPGTLYTKNVMSATGQTLKNPALFKGDYKFQAWGADDKLELGNDALGAALAAMHFSPQVVLAGKHMKFAYAKPVPA